MQTVDNFVDAMERLLNSNVITAGKEIRSFLIGITEDEGLKDVVRSCSNGYLINEDFKRVVVEHGPLPESDEKKVAFITALLFAIDTGKVDLSELVKMLFPTKSTSAGYDAFLSLILKPYAESFVNILVGEPVSDVTESQTPIYDKMNADVTAAARELIADVCSSNASEETKKAVKFAGNGLIYALTFNDAFLTEIAYAGLINALRLYNLKPDAESYLTSTLKLYGVL